MNDKTEVLLEVLRERAVPPPLDPTRLAEIAERVAHVVTRRRSDLYAGAVLAALTCISAVLVVLAVRADAELTSIRVAISWFGGAR